MLTRPAKGWMGLLQRAGKGGGFRNVIMVALEGNAYRVHGFEEHLERLLGQLTIVGDVEAETVELVVLIAARDAHVQPAFGQHVGHGHVFGKA